MVDVDWVSCDSWKLQESLSNDYINNLHVLYFLGGSAIPINQSSGRKGLSGPVDKYVTSGRLCITQEKVGNVAQVQKGWTCFISSSIHAQPQDIKGSGLVNPSCDSGRTVLWDVEEQ